MEILRIIVLKLIKDILFVGYCLAYPFSKLQALKKKQSCPPINNEILLLPATEITRKIRKREISCEEVITAYVTRCNKVNPIINAIVEERFEAAIQEAEKIDDFLKNTTLDEAEIARKKPLLGVPITVKGSIAVQGMNHCVGVKENTLLKATCDADVVRRVREAGGIPLLVSNTPELCLWWDTFNKVTGATRNPYDTRRTPGGSSGGEAALLGAGASLLGLGSDIAGSARVPAMFCGVFGHKPTPNWVPVKGHKPSATDEDWQLYFAIGPMVRYAVDLPLFLTAISQSAEAKININKKVRLENMKFFYMNDCGSAAMNSVNNETKNTINKLVEHLETTYTITVQKAKLENMKSAFELSSIILLRIKDIYSIFNRSDDPTKSKNECMEALKYIFYMSSHTFPTVCYGLLKKLSERIPQSYYNKMIKKRTLLKEEMKDLLGDNGILIFPSFISSAHYPHECAYNVCNYTYLMVFNALGLPVTQCPLGFDRNQLPIGLQIIANPNCDHLTIAVAQEIERSFGGWREPC